MIKTFNFFLTSYHDLCPSLICTLTKIFEHKKSSRSCYIQKSRATGLFFIFLKLFLISFKRLLQFWGLYVFFNQWRADKARQVLVCPLVVTKMITSIHQAFVSSKGYSDNWAMIKVQDKPWPAVTNIWLHAIYNLN